MFNKFTAGLRKTRQAISNSISSFSEILGNQTIDSDTLEELEEALILADVGTAAAGDILQKLKSESKENDLDKTLARIIASKFAFSETEETTQKPKVILMYHDVYITL